MSVSVFIAAYIHTSAHTCAIVTIVISLYLEPCSSFIPLGFYISRCCSSCCRRCLTPLPPISLLNLFELLLPLPDNKPRIDTTLVVYPASTTCADASKSIFANAITMGTYQSQHARLQFSLGASAELGLRI